VSSRLSCCSRRSVVLLVVAMVLMLVTASSAAAATLGGTVTGQVSKGETKALPGVDVTAFEAGSGKALASIATDEDGKYVLEVPSGEYDIRFDPGSGSYEAITIHKVEVNEARTLNVLLASAGLVHLTGTLRDASGKAISGAPLVLQSGDPPSAHSETAADGSYSFAVAPGTYFLQAFVPKDGPPGLPVDWAVQTDEFELSGDETRDLELPAPSTLTIEVLGKEGAPVSGATVRPPEFTGTADLGDYTTSQLRTPTFEHETGEDGRATILVFDGVACGCSSPGISPPPGSGYGHVSFAVAEVKGDTTVAVHLGAAHEEDPEDVDAPQVHGLAIEPPEINTAFSAQTVILTAHIIDDLSGFKSGNVSFESPSGKQTAAGFEFKRVTGDAENGGYEIPVTFEQSSESGAWFISAIRLTDAAGNERTVEPEEMEERGLSRQVIVVSGEGEENPEDTDPPQLKDLAIEPQSIDTSTAEQPVLVTAAVADDLSGFKEGAVVFIAPNEKQIIVGEEFKLASGSATDGVYEVVVTFPQGAESGVWEIAKVRLRDHAGNEVSIPGVEIEEAELAQAVTVQDAQPPTVTGLSPSFGTVAGNTEVVISGTGFSGATEVKFGSAEAEFEVTSATSINAISPAGTGTVDVTVTTPAGTSETSPAGRFAYGSQVNLSSSPGASVYGQKITFTATIAAGGEGGLTPVGTVAFVDGSATIAVVNLNGKGTATFNTTQLGAGKHQITAVYSGDANHPTSKSSSLTQEVGKASTEVALTSTLNPAPYGATGTLKASVHALAPGSGTPAGTVTFREGEEILDVVQLSGHNATLSLKTLPLGAHEITASYSGDFNNDPSKSESLTQAIDQAETETSLTSTLNPAPYGSSGTLKATVKATVGGGTPAGTVIFREGESVLAIVPLSSGAAKYPLGDLSPGKYEITATYNGGENYAGSVASLSQTITKAETELSLTSSKNPAPEGASGTIKATIKPVSPGGGTPTGTVTFRKGEAVLATIPLSSKTATYPLKALAAGTHEITASYGGSANYGASEGSITQAITP
jgi:hypothetical protein